MTEKKVPDQAGQSNQEARAVWLAQVPASLGPRREHTARERRFEAHRLARRSGAQVVGEFLYTGSGSGDASDRVWGELLDFVRDVKATTLVLLRPHEMAHGFTDYYRRTEALERAGVRLVLPDDMGLRGDHVAGEAETMAA